MTIVINELTKFYGDNVVVNKVSLTVDDGEMFVLLGSSGSGKSTVLRLIAGLIQPDNGRIELHGRDVTYLTPQERHVGFVFQNYSVFQHMNVAENIAFGLRIRGVAANEQQERVAELLDLVELSGLGNRYAHQLSGGQQQRVALARALAYRPAILLLDEPFGALDVKIRAQLRRSLRQIQRQLGTTTIVVTHDQEEAFELADRIAIMDHGKLVEVGTSESLYYRPQTPFGATFIGGGNVLAGRKESGQIRLGQIQLPFPEGAPHHDDFAPVRILFRPEMVQIAQRPFPPESGIYNLGEGQIKERVFAGAVQRLKVELDSLQGTRPLSPRLDFGQNKLAIQCALFGAEASALLAEETAVWVGVRDYHVLNPSGLRILFITSTLETDKDSAPFVQQLAVATDGSTTLFNVATKPEDTAAVNQKLQTIRTEHLPHVAHLEQVTGQGNKVEAVRTEIARGNYELVIIDNAQAQADDQLWQLLISSGIPVLFTPRTFTPIEHLLICTAGGEPGKSDVRFGGRLARRLQASIKLLYISQEDFLPYDTDRVSLHLQQAQELLTTLGVAATYEIKPADSPSAGILQMVETGDYELLVVGVSVPPDAGQVILNSLDRFLVTHCHGPILVVPMLD